MENVNYVYPTEQKKKKNKKKVLLIALGIFLAVVLIIVAAISIIAARNVKTMHGCIDHVLQELQENYTLTPVDAGEYEEITLYHLLKFHVDQYTVEDLGNLSIMSVNLGVMQMSSIVITPFDKNLPLMSADYMYMLNNRIAYLEFYDLVEEKDDTYQQLLTKLSDIQKKYDYLENADVSPAWYEDLLTVVTYKSCDSGADQDLRTMLTDSLTAYIEHDKTLPLLSEAQQLEKRAMILAYTDGLINNGGVSTDVFKSALGPETTKDFFDSVFFGTTAN